MQPTPEREMRISWKPWLCSESNPHQARNVWVLWSFGHPGIGFVITWHQCLSSTICCGSKPHEERCSSTWLFWTALTNVVQLHRLQDRENFKLREVGNKWNRGRQTSSRGKLHRVVPAMEDPCQTQLICLRRWEPTAGVTPGVGQGKASGGKMKMLPPIYSSHWVPIVGRHIQTLGGRVVRGRLGQVMLDPWMTPSQWRLPLMQPLTSLEHPHRRQSRSTPGFFRCPSVGHSRSLHLVLAFDLWNPGPCLLGQRSLSSQAISSGAFFPLFPMASPGSCIWEEKPPMSQLEKVYGGWGPELGWLSLGCCWGGHCSFFAVAKLSTKQIYLISIIEKAD